MMTKIIAWSLYAAGVALAAAARWIEHGPAGGLGMLAAGCVLAALTLLIGREDDPAKPEDPAA